MITLYADENVDRRIVEGLRRRNVDVLTAREAGLTGRIDDARHLALAADRGRVLISGDDDLLRIAQAWSAADRPHPGLIFFHPGWTKLGTIVRDVATRARTLTPDDARSRVFFVPRDRLR